MRLQVRLLLLVCAALPVPLKAQIVRSIVCDDLQVRAGANAPIQCAIDAEGESGFVYRWMSADAGHLGLLSSPAVQTPVFSAPTELAQTLDIVYTMVVHTVDGQFLGEAVVRVTVRPGCLQCPDGETIAPPQLQCPASVHLQEGAHASIQCRLAGPIIDNTLQYTWTGGGPVTLYPVNAPNPTIMAPLLPYGQSSLTVPLTLAVISRQTQQTTLRHITVVVNARGPQLMCPEHVTVDAGASTMLRCDTPAQGAAAYIWTGLWGTSTGPLSATHRASPTFTAPRVRQDTMFHYVVSMRTDQHEARHRVTVQVRAHTDADSEAYCPPMTLEELEQRPLDCRVPAGHHVRWRGPTGPAAPKLTQTTLAAPEVESDTTFTYQVEFCPDGEGVCTAGMPWTVTVLNRKPPAVSCPEFLETYAGEPDLLINCAVSGGIAYEFVWYGANLDLLSHPDMLSPTFNVPNRVEEDKEYAYTLTVTDAHIGSSSADIRIRVRKRGQIEISCEGLDYYAYVGSADFPVQPQCDEPSGRADPMQPFNYRWLAQHAARDLERLSSALVSTPMFDVPDTLAAPYVYEYVYRVGSRYSDPAAAVVRVHVAPFPAEFDITVNTVAVQFGEQSAGSEVMLDPMTGTMATKAGGSYHLGRMIFAADEDLDVDISLTGGTLRNQDGDGSVRLRPQWTMSESCLAPSVEALRSDRARISLRAATDRCTVLNIGGNLDLRGAAPGRYSGTLEVTVESGEVREPYWVPVFATVVDTARPVTTGPGGTFVSADDAQRVTRVQSLSIYPRQVLLTPEHAFGTFSVSNPSLITQEVLVDPVFGYLEAQDGTGAEVMVEMPTAAVQDLGAELLLYPKVFTLPPGQSQQVHYALREDRSMGPSVYATQIEFQSRPRRYIRTDLLPVPDDSSRVALVSLRVQSAYLPGQGASAVTATQLSQGTLLLETADGPFAGEIVAVDHAGNELGRRSLLLLTRRILQWPLNAPAGSEVTLNFVTPHGNAPRPIPLRWQ
ncbi:MAG: hypothetical protein OXI38_02285 [Bacteroidota bacterium]|nr:hypothetical protein [Bacteroidota bacterium]